ncbi:MAG: FAD-dependent oxidoreductase [Candidatus Aenigmatarchaeota archaeon]
MVDISEIIYDVLIVGGAAAGLTAGLFTTRRDLRTLLLTKDIGGQSIDAIVIENYPGYLEISGLELMRRFEEQARKFGLEIKFEEVKKIEEFEKDGKPMFLVKTDNNQYTSRTLILAFGKTPRSLNVPGEDKFIGHGVSYCANCDAPFFRNKIVAVVGGGNAALDAALFCSEISKKVYLIHRRKEFRAFEIVINELKQKKNVEMILDTIIKEIRGDKLVKSIVVENLVNGEIREIELDGVFIEIGSEVKTDFIKGFVELDDQGQIIINNLCETSRPGVFAAGDVTNTPTYYCSR